MLLTDSFSIMLLDLELWGILKNTDGMNERHYSIMEVPLG